MSEKIILKPNKLVKDLNKKKLNGDEVAQYLKTHSSLEAIAEKRFYWLKLSIVLLKAVVRREDCEIAFNNIVNFIKRKVKNADKEAVKSKEKKKLGTPLLYLWNKIKAFIEEDSTCIDLSNFSIWLLKTVIDFSASTRSLTTSLGEFSITENLNFVDDHFKEASLDVILKLKCVILPKDRNCDIVITICKYVLKEHSKPTEKITKFLKLALLAKILLFLSKTGMKDASSLFEQFMKMMMIPVKFWAWAEQHIGLSISEAKPLKKQSGNRQLKWFLQQMNVNLVHKVLFDDKRSIVDSKKKSNLSNSEVSTKNIPTVRSFSNKSSDSNKSPAGKVETLNWRTSNGQSPKVEQLWTVTKINEKKEKQKNSLQSTHKDHEIETANVINSVDSRKLLNEKKRKRIKRSKNILTNDTLKSEKANPTNEFETSRKFKAKHVITSSVTSLQNNQDSYMQCEDEENKMGRKRKRLSKKVKKLQVVKSDVVSSTAELQVNKRKRLSKKVKKLQEDQMKVENHVISAVESDVSNGAELQVKKRRRLSKNEKILQEDQMNVEQHEISIVESDVSNGAELHVNKRRRLSKKEKRLQKDQMNVEQHGISIVESDVSYSAELHVNKKRRLSKKEKRLQKDQMNVEQHEISIVESDVSNGANKRRRFSKKEKRLQKDQMSVEKFVVKDVKFDVISNTTELQAELDLKKRKKRKKNRYNFVDNSGTTESVDKILLQEENNKNLNIIVSEEALSENSLKSKTKTLKRTVNENISSTDFESGENKYIENKKRGKKRKHEELYLVSKGKIMKMSKKKCEDSWIIKKIDQNLQVQNVILDKSVKKITSTLTESKIQKNDIPMKKKKKSILQLTNKEDKMVDSENRNGNGKEEEKRLDKDLTKKIYDSLDKKENQVTKKVRKLRVRKRCNKNSLDDEQQSNKDMNISKNDTPLSMPISVFSENKANETCITLSDLEIVEDKQIGNKNIKKSLTKEKDSDVDEASGNDSDIVECDEDHTMFTKEETHKYHQFQLKQVKLQNVKAILSNIKYNEDEKLVDEEPPTEEKMDVKQKLEDSREDIALILFNKGKSEDSSQTFKGTNAPEVLPEEEDLPYGDDADSDLEVIFATIKKDTNYEDSLKVKTEMTSDDETCDREPPLIKSSAPLIKRSNTSESFVGSIFNIYQNRAAKDEVDILYDGTKHSNIGQISATEAAIPLISVPQKSSKCAEVELKKIQKENLDENSEIEIIESNIVDADCDDVTEEASHLNGNDAEMQEFVESNDVKEGNSTNEEECHMDEVVNENEKRHIENDKTIEDESRVDKDEANKEDNLKETETECEELNESVNVTVNIEDSFIDVVPCEEPQSIEYETEMEKQNIIQDSVPSDLDAFPDQEFRQEIQTVNELHSRSISEWETIQHYSDSDKPTKKNEVECATKSESEEWETTLGSSSKACELSESVDKSEMNSGGDSSLPMENLSTEDFSLRMEESFIDGLKEDKPVFGSPHRKVLCFDEAKVDEKMTVKENNKETTPEISLVSNESISDSEIPVNVFNENKENIMDNKQKEEMNDSSVSEVSFEKEASIQTEESEHESSVILKSLSHDSTLGSASKIVSKRASVEKAACNMTALTPLKVANAALSNEIVISPQVSDEENSSQILNEEVDGENILPYIPDDNILSKSCVEEEQEDEVNERNHSFSCFGSPSEKSSTKTNKKRKSLNKSSSSNSSKPSPLRLSNSSTSSLTLLTPSRISPLRQKLPRTPSPTKSLSSKKHLLSLSSSSKVSLILSSDKQSSVLSSRTKSPFSSIGSSPILSSKFPSPISRKQSPQSLNKRSPSSSPLSVNNSAKNESSIFAKPSPKVGCQEILKESPSVTPKSSPSLVRRSPRHTENIQENTVKNEVSKPEDSVILAKESDEDSMASSPSLDPSEARDKVLSPLKTRYSLRRLKNPMTPEKQVVPSPRVRRNSLSSIKSEDTEAKLLSSPARSRARRNSLSGCVTPVRRSRRISGLPEDIAE